MKHLFTFALLLFTATLWSQVKPGKATRQKTMAGMGGIFMNYIIEFNAEQHDSVRIDSVVTIADKKSVSHLFNYDSKGRRTLALNQVLAKPPKCATCQDTSQPQANLTKGVRVYYHYKGKKGQFKVRKFQELPDLMTP